MKKLLAALALIFVSTSALSWNNGYRYGYYGYRGPVYINNGYNNNWVVPAVAGVAVGALAARAYYAPPAVYYTPAPVYYAPPPAVYVQQANPAPEPPVGYHWQYILDPACNCYKYAMLPN